MFMNTNLLINFTKRSASIWTKRVAMKPFQPHIWEPLTMVTAAESKFNFAKFYASKVQFDDDNNAVVKDQPETRKQNQPKPSPLSMVANVAELPDPLDGNYKAELEEIVKVHNENMDKLMNSFQEQINRHRERSKHQMKESQESYQKMIEKLKNERPKLKQLPKFDFAKQVSEERDRKTAMKQKLIKDGDPKNLVDQVVQLTIDLEAERTRNQQHGDKYYGLMSIFNATKRSLLDKIEDEKLNATKYVYKALLPVLDALESINYTLSAHDNQGDSEELQELHKHMKFAYTEFCSILQRHKITEINTVGVAFKHTIHQIAHEEVDESVPPYNVISIERKGYMVGDYCLRPARVVVSRKDK